MVHLVYSFDRMKRFFKQRYLTKFERKVVSFDFAEAPELFWLIIYELYLFCRKGVFQFSITMKKLLRKEILMSSFFWTFVSVQNQSLGFLRKKKLFQIDWPAEEAESKTSCTAANTPGKETKPFTNQKSERKNYELKLF